MADNVTISEGTGTTIGSDEIGGVKYQRVKMIVGADGTNDGDVASGNPLPVTGTVTGITNTVGVYLDSIRQTIGVRVGQVDGTVAVYFDQSEPMVKVKTGSTVAVSLDPGHELGSVKGINTTVTIKTDPGYELGSIKGINSTVAVYFDQSEPTVKIKMGQTIAVYFDPSNPNVKANAGTGTFNMQLDPGHELGSVKGINSTVAVYFDQSTPSVKAVQSGTYAVYFDQSEPTIKVKDTYATSIISETISGSMVATNTTAGIIINAEAAHNIKIYALALTTTAQVQTVIKFTGHQTERWRYALQAPAAGIAGANIAVSPPGFLFASGAGNSLSIFGDSGSLFHYSIGYFKESA